ncbi:MAG: PAS domain-containing protein [Anaplasmataceae bacterium]|nr:PAS domain-containing protein [Anaplasmataceae bacterium]
MFEESTLIEKRTTNKLCSYWSSIRGNRNYPNKLDIDFDDIEEIKEYCFILSIKEVGNKMEYKFDYIGSTLHEIFEQEQHQVLSINYSIISLNPESALESIDEVMESGYPVINETQTIVDDGNELSFRQCFLPLSDNNKDINSILGTFRCKIS